MRHTRSTFKLQEKRITKIFRGVDNTKFAEVAKKEVEYFKARLEGVIDDRKTYNFDEVLPEEQVIIIVILNLSVI